MSRLRVRAFPVAMSRMCTDSSVVTIGCTSGASQQMQVTGEPLPNVGPPVLFATSQVLTVPSDKPHAK